MQVNDINAIISKVNYEEISDPAAKICFKITRRTYADAEEAQDLRKVYIDAGRFEKTTDFKIVVKEDKALVSLMNRHFALGIYIFIL